MYDYELFPQKAWYYCFSCPNFITDPFFIASVRHTHGGNSSRRLPVRFLIFDHMNSLKCLSPGQRFLNECDSIFIASSHSYEDVSLIQVKSWLKSLPQGPLPIYAIGPLLPSGYGRHFMESSELEKSNVERDIEVFLKEMQSKHGEKSVIFVGLFPYY